MSKSKIITIKRELDIKEDSCKQYLLENMRYRNFIYNMGIEYILDNNERFNKNTFDTWFYNTYEKNNDKYKTKISGIRNEVSVDLKRCVDTVWRDRKNKVKANFRFRRYNRNYGSFRVYDKNHDRIKLKDNNTFSFRLVKGLDRLIFKTKESMFSDTYSYETKDIKTISFIQKNGKFYISFSVSVTFHTFVSLRKKKAGLDIGIRNPVVLYDGDGENVYTYNINKKMLKRIKHLEKRISLLQNILSHKVPNSNNYKKLSLKIARIHERVSNIRKDWRYKTSHNIVNNYNVIIVDDFNVSETLIKKKDKKFKGKSKKQINRGITRKGMYLFTECLKYMAEKYSCLYIKAEKNTTRTCCSCGHVNDPLPLSKKNLICSKCNMKIHRDINASINCYNQDI